MKREAVALVDEPRCIGCTRCIDACPVDAIVGAQGVMHTVVESWCIGCGLCVPPCPVDCIDMVPAREHWTLQLKQAAKARAVKRRERLHRPVYGIPNRAALVAATLARRKK